MSGKWYKVFNLESGEYVTTEDAATPIEAVYLAWNRLYPDRVAPDLSIGRWSVALYNLAVLTTR